MTFKEWMKENRPENIDKDMVGGVYLCPFRYDLESEKESRKNCKPNGGKGCRYCWNREMPEAKTPDKAGQAKAVRMPKLSTGTTLQIVNRILLDCYESLNFHEQPYLNGIIDAVCSVISFEVEDND